MKLVAWTPKGSALGAVMAPPGLLTPSAHRRLLEARVQAMVDQEPNPKAALKRVLELWEPLGLLAVAPEPGRWVGWELVEAAARVLRDKGALLDKPVLVPATDNPGIREMLEESQLTEWASELEIGLM